MRITPDRSLTNARAESLIRALTALYEPPVARWNGRGFDHPATASWEIVLSTKECAWYLSVPTAWQQVIGKQLATCWPRATIQPDADPLTGFMPSATASLELKEHYCFPLATRAQLLPALLDTLQLMGEGNRACVQVLLTPASPDWWEGAAAAYEGFRRGEMPRRLHLEPATLGRLTVRGMAGVVFEVVSVVDDLFEVEREPVDLDGISKAEALREGPMGQGCVEKLRGDAFEVTIRLAVEGPNAEQILRSLGWAFREMDADNSLLMRKTDPAKTIAAMRALRLGWKLDHDLLSVSEVAPLLHLPSTTLQERYHLAAVEHRESDLPQILTAGGLLLGSVTYHGHESPVYLPTADLDELCLPHVVIGGMGSGKTRGFAANLAAEAVTAGFGAVVIDPAKGEVGDELESVLRPDQLLRVRFGRQPVALDWREARHGERMQNRLAAEMVSFFEAASEEAGAQTVRYLRAAAKAVPGGKLNEVVRLFTEPAYRRELIPTMRSAERLTWEAFDALSDARQAQVAMPVLNRLDVVLGDDYLAECMEAGEGLDFVELLEQPRVIVLDLPKGDLGGEALDVLGGLLATKLDLAMFLRRSTFPVMVIQDEPHQYQRCARVWRNAAVESRKWRFAYTWLFHDWTQIPRDAASVIMSAGPHLHLYASSAATYRSLAQEIAPFDVEEAMRTPRYSAINVIRAGGRTVTPFLAKMTPPPSYGRKRKSGGE